MSKESSEEFRQFLKDYCIRIEGNNNLDTKFATKPPVYNFNGCILKEFLLKGYFESLQIKVRDTDIILSSFPKTGTTWAQELVYLVQHEADMTKMNEIALMLRFPFLEILKTPVDEINADQSTRFFKTHMPYHLLPGKPQDRRYKIVYICRNAKDTAVSLYHFYKMNYSYSYIGTLSEFIDLFVNDLVIYSPYGPHVIEFWEKSKTDKNILFLQYEDLHQNFKENIRRIAAFLDKNLSDAQVDIIANRCSFSGMSQQKTSNYAYVDGIAFDFNVSKFMRKGIVGDWKNHFSNEDNEKMDKWIEKNFGNTDLKFVYE
ncbi:hypothetical protein CHUAL_008462 [Chamberlinius hualienensis]